MSNNAVATAIGRSPRQRSSRATVLIASVVGGLLIGACTAAASPGASGGTTPSPVTGAIAHPTGPRDLVIRYEQTGGFVAPQFLLTRYPVVSVYGDGS
ncbi:MAG TPA: hypothetical protein VK656_07070, partial [Candidatus Acidoferrum sp.]|nr:hypothetical protein [Candidatus Acidoferrum sp.]